MSYDFFYSLIISCWFRLCASLSTQLCNTPHIRLACSERRWIFSDKASSWIAVRRFVARRPSGIRVISLDPWKTVPKYPIYQNMAESLGINIGKPPELQCHDDHTRITSNCYTTRCIQKKWEKPQHKGLGRRRKDVTRRNKLRSLQWANRSNLKSQSWIVPRLRLGWLSKCWFLSSAVLPHLQWGPLHKYLVGLPYLPFSKI